ncbi:MAG TPA: glycosyltransferase family 39 protein [Solirubrobacteraceae bacterium]|nr:glycosyltransferase family 39 protein [Solirubrobacteraceae bacterium]
MTELLQRPRPAIPRPPRRSPATPPRPERSDALPTAALPGAPERPRRETPSATPVGELMLAGTRTWVRRHRLSIPIVLGLMAVTVLLVGTGITRSPGFADDEGTYVAEAWAFVTHGQLSHYTYWYDHPPLGWIQLGILTELFGPLLRGATAVATARSLMLLPALATASLLYVLGRRLGLRRGFSALAVLLLVASPLGIDSLRQVYLENFALPWVLLAFVLAQSPSRRLWAFAGAGACFAVGVLSKETMLLFLPGLLLAIVGRADRRTRSFCLAAFGASFVLLGIGYPLYALLKGELIPGPGHVSLLQAVTWQLAGRQGTGSVFASGSQAQHLVLSWTQVDPWLLGLGLAAAVLCLGVRRLRPVGLTLVVPVLVALRGGYLPEPFDIALLPFCALAIAGVLDLVWTRARGGIPLRTRASTPRGAMGLAGAVGLLVALTLLITPGWVRGDRAQMTADATAPIAGAEHWIAAHVNRRARLMIDDTMYVDLVRDGFTPRYGVVWFYKLGFSNNLDPAIVRHLPRGWREFDYVVSTPVIRSALAQNPSGDGQVRAALAHSRPVARFGRGAGAIVIRRITGPHTGSGALSR